MVDMSRVSQPKNPRRLSPLGALRVVDADKWARAVRKAMREAQGRVPAAAEALGVSTRQLFRWLDDPRLQGIERAAQGTRPTDD
jgi:hypothetical protein